MPTYERRGDTVGELSFIDGGDVGGPVPIRVRDLVVRAAEHVEQSHQPDPGADLLAGLPDGRLSRGLTDIDSAAAWLAGPDTVTGEPDCRS